MTIKIQSGRQFAKGAPDTTLFDTQGAAGTYLQKASEKLISSSITVQLRGAAPDAPVTLKTANEWSGFLATYASTKDATQQFPARFGITFSDFVNLVDDAAAGDDQGITLDLRPGSSVAQALSLDEVDGDYATKMVAGSTIDLTGDAGATGKLEAVGVTAIGPDILARPIASDWQRDRAEQESWADFKLGNGAGGKFKDLTGAKPFEKLYQPKWDDPAAMELVEKFTLPLHLEVRETRPDGTVRFQDRHERFRDIYYDDKDGTLERAGATTRARVRFEDKPPHEVRRVLVQAKEGRTVNGESSEVRKFEKRWEGNFTDEAAAQQMLLTGKERNGQPLTVSQKLYSLAKEKGVLPTDGVLRLEPKYLILQRRRRTHLELDSSSTVKTRRAGLQVEIDRLTAAGQPIPPALQKFADKLDGQIRFLDEASALLRKYNQWMPTGEAFIVSADRYSVYDPAARAGNLPTDPEDEAGRVGRGPLHVEAEWDSASSDPFMKALDAVEAKVAAEPNNTEAAGDLTKLQAMRATFLKDVFTTVAVTRQLLLDAGLEEDTGKLAKDERAAQIFNQNPRATNWV